MSQSNDPTSLVTEPAVVLVWDPELLSEEQYAKLVELLGNVVRSHGGAGIKLLSPNSFEATIDEGVPA